jgi:uncharacterized protein (TIGR02186 family)
MAAIDIDVSEPKLEITTGFSGDILTVFGTIEPKGDIIILVRGPKKETVIRRKIDVMGLWVQAESLTFVDVPGYYNIASSKPVNLLASAETLKQYRLGLDSLTFKTKRNDISSEKYVRFQEALIQGKQLSQLYSLTPNAVTFLNERLFKTRIYMPSNVPLGDYTIEAFLFQNGNLVDNDIKPFTVVQTGLTGDIHKFAFDKPLIYGISVIFIALFAGFMATILLRRD